MDKLQQLVQIYNGKVVNNNINWAYFNEEAALPRQGWKIHISAHLENCLEVFERIIPLLIKKKISFKTVATLADLEKLNIGLFGQSQIGKFITIYPEEKLTPIASELLEATKEFTSPIISSDKRIESSVVYYRYGIIDPKDGRQDYLINNDGLYIKDERKYKTAVPTWLSDPFLSEDKTEGIGDLVITKVIRKRGRGGVYEGFFKKNKVIVKEALPHGEYVSVEDNGQLRVQNEISLLKKLETFEFTPKILDMKNIEEHVLYAMEKIEGISLKQLILKHKNIPYEIIEEVEEKLEQIVKLLHEKGIYHCDLNPDNILLGDKIYLIDLEHAVDFSDGNRKVRYGTNHFYPAYQDYMEELDKSELQIRDFYGIQQSIKAMKEPRWYQEIVNA